MRLPADATLEHAPALAMAMSQDLAGSQGRWQIDASGVTAIDSSTLALLLQAKRLAEVAGREIEIVGAPAKLGELARLYGIDSLLPLSETSDASASASASRADAT